MNNIYKSIYRYGEDEFIVKKSKFIGYAKPIDTEEEALDFIEEVKTKNKDATHNVYAYVCGENSNVQRFSDDGEPSGTAGIPVLEVIKKENLRNVVVVVTRYYGGTQLGAGGLIRAYTKGAKIGLVAGIITKQILHIKLRIRLGYTQYGSVENYLMSEGHLIDDTIYDDAVNIYVYVQFSKKDEFKRDIQNLTSGDADIEYEDEKHLPIKNGKYLN